MVDYAKFQALAERLIGANGRTITFSKFDTTPADPAEPWRGPGPATETTFDVVAVFVGGPTVSSDEQGTMIQFQERAFLVAETLLPTGTDLAEYTKVVDGGAEWDIVRVDTTKPGDTSIMYRVVVER